MLFPMFSSSIQKDLFSSAPPNPFPTPSHTLSHLPVWCLFYAIYSPASLPSTYTVDPTSWPALKTGFSSICLEWMPPIFPHQAGDGVGQPQILLSLCHIHMLMIPHLSPPWRFMTLLQHHLLHLFCSHKVSSYCLSSIIYFGPWCIFLSTPILSLSGIAAVIIGLSESSLASH